MLEWLTQSNTQTIKQSNNQAISFSYMFCSRCQNHYFWWLWSECSPLPIPNREVKPHIADDTALVCGKVGRRQFFIRSSKRDSFFYCLHSLCLFSSPPDSACAASILIISGIFIIAIFSLSSLTPFLSFLTPFLLSSLESLVSS